MTEKLSVVKSCTPLTVANIRARKGQTPLVCLTSYTTPVAKLMDSHADIILVGDSLGMVVYGMENTRGVTMDMMINHGKAVMRGTQNALVVVDMPFGSYQESKEQAYRNAARIMAEVGCAAVKLEGGAEMAETVAYLAQRCIPVMGHIGLLPQSVQTVKGYRIQGRSPEDAQRILADARAIEKAGAFSVVIEAVIETLAREITETISIPTIGIGASNTCDGQILVIDDMLGTFRDFTPKFVKKYADLATTIETAVKNYADDVRTRAFPTEAQTFQNTLKTAAEKIPMPPQKKTKIG